MAKPWGLAAAAHGGLIRASYFTVSLSNHPARCLLRDGIVHRDDAGFVGCARRIHIRSRLDHPASSACTEPKRSFPKNLTPQLSPQAFLSYTVSHELP